MKKFLSLSLALVLVLALTACGGSKEDNVLKVAASSVPHAEILAQCVDAMAEKGYDLQVTEYGDYVVPNTAVEEGEEDANYFQHVPYLEGFNEEHDTDLSSAGLIHYEPFGIYPGRISSLDDLGEGAIVSMPNDAVNESRALLLLEAQGLLTLKEGVGLGATILDVVDNPLNLEFMELEAAQLTKSLQDVDVAVINGNYAIQDGLSASEDALAIEDKDSIAAETYANAIVVRTGDEENEYIKALVEALQSEEVRAFIEETYDGAVIPKF